MMLLDALEAAVMLDIQALRQQGGPDDWHVEEVRRRLDALRIENIAESILFPDKNTPRVFQAYAECIAVLAFMPGGVKFAGRWIEAHAEETGD